VSGNVVAHAEEGGISADEALKYNRLIAASAESIAKNPQDANAYRSRGWAYGHLKQFNKLISDCNQSINLNPKDSRSYAVRAWGEIVCGQDAKAIGDLTEAISLDGTDAISRWNRAYIYNHERLLQKAIDDYTQIIRLRPGDADAYAARGYDYVYSGEYGKAISDCTKALELLPKAPTPSVPANASIKAEIYASRAVAYCDICEYQKAIDDSTSAITLDPTCSRAFLIRGSAYGSTGHLSESTKDCTQAIKLAPEDSASYANRGMNYADLGLYRQAVSDYNQAIHIDPKVGAYYAERCASNENLGNYECAIADCNAAIRLTPNSPRNFAATVHRERAYRMLRLKASIESVFASFADGDYFSTMINVSKTIFNFYDKWCGLALLPQLLVGGLVLFAARRKHRSKSEASRFVLFKSRAFVITAGPPPKYKFSANQTLTLAYRSVWASISLLCATLLMCWCSVHPMFKDLMHTSLNANLNVDSIVPIVLEVFFAATVSAVLFGILDEFYFLSKKFFECGNFVFAPGRTIVNTCFFGAVLLILLPLLSIFICPKVSQEFAMISEVGTICTVLSGTFVSMAGLTVALLFNTHIVTGESGVNLANDCALLRSPAFWTIGVNKESDERLRDLIGLCLAIGDFDSGCLLSKILLQRIESR
jgi:tetratricopeptide (TPR) repeat protein